MKKFSDYLKESEVVSEAIVVTFDIANGFEAKDLNSTIEIMLIGDAIQFRWNKREYITLSDKQSVEKFKKFVKSMK